MTAAVMESRLRPLDDAGLAGVAGCVLYGICRLDGLDR
jgi:hypothetical protein